jgi:DNA polymerase-4
MPRRWIAHLDMDAFYASVELLRYPDLRGRPVVVGGRRAHQPETLPDGTRRYSLLRDYAGRGVATTSTYEARALGVHSAMGLMKAAALAPDAVLLPADFEQYTKYSRLFKAAVAEVAPVIENRGIDEIYIDLSDVPGAWDASDEDAHAGIAAVARRIKDSVRDATGLTCSIGITPNKLLSKIASELGKPDGLSIITFADISQRIWPLPAKRINGIGPKAAKKLEALGVRSIGDLAAMDPLRLVDEFGANYGAWLHEAAHGRDEREVVTHSEPKSISCETTFERDLHARTDREELGAIFTKLCERLAGALERKGYAAKTIAVKLRFDDFKIVTRAVTLSGVAITAQDIRKAAGQCLKKCPLERKLRLIGVRADKLSRLGDLAGRGDSESAPAEGQLALPLAQ